MKEQFDLAETKRKMEGALHALQTDFASLRTGRASVTMLDTVMVDSYGSLVPINQIGTVGVAEARLLTVQVWDKGLVHAVCKAIISSGLGLNPQPDGQLVRLPIPDLSEDRRKELSKLAAKYAEQARIAARNVRRDSLDAVKGLEKAKKISEDELKSLSDDIQKATDEAIKKIDENLKKKEKDIMSV